MQTNNSKEKVRQLQNKLYLTAKKCDSRRFHALYDKVYREDILFEAWKRVKANKGSSGVDGIRIEDIEEMGIEKYLSEIKSELMDGKYKPSSVKRVMIPKQTRNGCRHWTGTLFVLSQDGTTRNTKAEIICRKWDLLGIACTKKD